MNTPASSICTSHFNTKKTLFKLRIFFYCRKESGDFESLDITPYSSPPDLPEVMKNQEAANGKEQVA